MSVTGTTVTYHADWLLFYNPPTWPPPKPTRYQQLSSFVTERIDLRYDHPDYIHPVQNLELHSAAASGNLGLVHYALTHGQPVNSVLHGVLPLHAACSGGSVEVVKMLIERGANVNAPRLPRRYSDGRKSNAPSVGTAGSTPLHFAAANGHAPIVQILLACGAVPDKPDKNGMTPEALAEIQGHTEVIRVMRAWETLHPSEPYAASTAASDDGAMSEMADVGSPSVGDSAVSEDGYYGYGQGYDGQLQQPSRKGKERAFSFSSAKSELSVPAVKMKNSIEGFFRRTSRSGSFSNPTAEPSSPTPLRISTFSDGSTGTGTHSGGYDTGSPGLHSPFFNSAPPSPLPDMANDQLTLPEHDEAEGSGTPLTRVTSGDSTILAPPNPPFRASSPSSNRSGGSSTVLAMARSSRSVSRTQDTIDETASNASEPSEYEPALETIEQEESEGTDPSRRSVDSSSRPGALDVDADRAQQDTDGQVEESPTSPTMHIHHTLPPRHTFSSRRPSLPSILEKAAHPGQAFRNAIRRDRHASESTPTIPEDPSQPKQGTFLRGRKNETSPPHRRFGTIKGFFRRGNSPPSRSPSPPKKNAILPDELDERLRRASLDMSQSEGSSADNRDEITVPPMPHSAPATKTRFFEDLSEDNSDLRMAALASLSPRPHLPAGAAAGQPRAAPPLRKTSGGVMISSPLANEVRDQPDNRSLASSVNNPNFRRSKTEVVRSGSSSPRLSSMPPSSPVHTKRRSATLPSQPRVPGLEWDATASLRRAAASEVIRRNSEKLRQAVEEAEARTEDGESINEADGDETPQRPGRHSQEEQDTPHVSDGEHHDEEDDLTPEATPAVEKTKSELELNAASHAEPTSSARHRGASIGSFTTDSTRLSTPSVSTNPHMSMSIASYDTGSGSERYHLAHTNANRSPTFQPDKLVQLRAPPNSVVDAGGGGGRSRGNTVSSVSLSESSGMRSSSQGLPSGSTPPTSMTPPSALGRQFPPVPEHDDEPKEQQQAQAALTREEAAELVKQNELDILQLAQLPQSLDSSKSLAAQLAAYGENHQLEQQIAAEERRAKRRAAKAQSKGKGRAHEVSTTDTDSFVSATSGSADEDVHSRSSSSVRTTGSSALRMTTLKHDKSGMYHAEAPKTNMPALNNIYDRRAAAYREKLQALTSVPSSLHGTGPARPRAYSAQSAHRGQAQSFQSSSSLRHVSSPLPSPSEARPKTPAQRSSQKYTLHPGASATSQAGQSQASFYTAQTKPRRKTHPAPGGAPPPIADVVNARFSGMPAPPPAPPMSASPYVSIFSSRYSGHPHDGGDSDDSDSEPTRYTVIENDWRGGHVVNNREIETQSFKRNNKWGQFKGAIGHLGRKAS